MRPKIAAAMSEGSCKLVLGAGAGATRIKAAKTWCLMQVARSEGSETALCAQVLVLLGMQTAVTGCWGQRKVLLTLRQL
jgi:hypothetical protein